MADEDNDEVIVSLPADTSAVQVVKVEPKKAVETHEDDPVADLKNQFAQMTQRVSVAESTAQQATQRAEEATGRLQHMEGQVVSSQLDTVMSGIAAAEAELTSAEQTLAAAIEAGDAMAQARANRVIATAASRLERLAEAKEDLQDAVKRRPAPGEKPRQQVPQRQQSADPIEAFTTGMSSKSAAWIRAHPECVTDQKKNARMLAAHNLAIADDVLVDSEEYFRRIEEWIGKAPVKKTDPEPKVIDGRRPSSAAASGTGAGGDRLSGGGVEVRLTKGEARSATDGTLVWNYDDPTGQKRWNKGEPIGLAEMARRKHEGIKNGLYDKSFSEN
jgi:hypothetical protein